VEAREEARLSQAALAKKLARPQSYVSKYERGGLRLDLAEFMEVCGAMGCDAAAMLRALCKGARPVLSPRLRAGARAGESRASVGPFKQYGEEALTQLTVGLGEPDQIGPNRLFRWRLYRPRLNTIDVYIALDAQAAVPHVIVSDPTDRDDQMIQVLLIQNTSDVLRVLNAVRAAIDGEPLPGRPTPADRWR
jgi:transcriptional regulator with XRE-family HTH domain